MSHDDHHDSDHGHGHGRHPALDYVPENVGTYLVQFSHHFDFDVPTFEKCLDELHRQGNKYTTWISLEIVTIAQKTGFYISCEKAYAERMHAVIYAFFPTVEIAEESYPSYLGHHTEIAGGEIVTDSSHYYPLKNYKDFPDNSLLTVISAFSLLSLEDFGVFQIVLKPFNVDHWEKFRYRIKAKLALKTNLKRHIYGQKFNDALWERALARIEKNRFNAQMGVYFESTEPGKAERCYEMFSANLKACRIKFVNDLNIKKIKDPTELQKFIFSRALKSKKMVLATDEVTMFHHYPSSKIGIANINYSHSRTGEPPHHLATGEDMDTEAFAHTNFRNRHLYFGFKKDDRRRHLYVVGKSGSGKSKFLELLIKSDFHSGAGVAVIDPHGDLAEEILQFIPKERINDVLYFNVQDDAFPIAFNPLANITPENKHIIIHGFISIFQKLFSALWLPGMEHVLRYSLLAVMDLPEPTINDVQKMLTDKSFRQDMIGKITEPSIRNFWANEFLQLQEKQGHKTVTPLINKLGEFTLNPLVQRIVSQKKCNINFETILNEKKILIANLAKGKIGENNCSLLGSMLVTKIQETAMARVGIPEEKREDFYLYIDEFQNFASNAFTVILSEARKYRLNLIIAHQYLAQLTPDVRNAAFGNVGSIVSFRVGPEDAIAMGTEFTPTFNAEDIVNLSIRDIYLKMSVHGKTSSPFSARTLTVKIPEETYVKEIVAASRAAYAKPKKEVEEEIFAGSNQESADLLKFPPPLPLGPLVAF